MCLSLCVLGVVLLALQFGGGFFFQAEDGIRDLVRSRGLGDVYKRQELALGHAERSDHAGRNPAHQRDGQRQLVTHAVLKLSLIHI